MEHLRLKQQHGFGTTDDGLLPYDATKLPMQAGASIYADDHDAEEDEDRDIVGSDLKLDHDYAPHKSSQGREGIMSLQFQSMDGIHKDQDDDQEAKPERDYGVTAATKTSPAIFSFITMQLQFCSVFFIFSLGTRTHYFGRTILHGGAKYRATGRGFVVRHIKFADNYRLYSRSHFVKALEVALLLIVYIAYGYTKGGSSSFILLTISSWFMVISWLFAPYIFNPSGFEWQKTVEDFDDWTNWLFYKGGVGVKGENSWESWWDEEQAHIQTFRGRNLETILSLRFLLFQYGIVYKLKITGHNTSLAIYGFSWIVLLVMVLLFKLFTATPRKSTALPTFVRFLQGLLAIGIIAAIACLIGSTNFTIADLFASALAFLATGWCIL